jgi:hypothetical protein
MRRFVACARSVLFAAGAAVSCAAPVSDHEGQADVSPADTDGDTSGDGDTTGNDDGDGDPDGEPAIPGYDLPVVLPACSTSDPEVRMIQSGADWATVNDPSARVFCVHPGNYTAQGQITLSADGTASAQRYLRYYDPGGLSAGHPVSQAEAERAIVRGLRFTGATHWIVDGLTFRETTRTTLVTFDASSRDNVLNRVLIEGGGNGGGQLQFGSSSYNTLQNSVLRRTARSPGNDCHCVVLGGSTGISIVANEIYDCAGDSVQIHPEGGEGSLIADNDLYITPALYSDCDGNLDPSGACACAEGALDIKGVLFDVATSAPEAKWVEILDNRMWGFRQTDVACGGSGSPGEAVVIHTTDASDFVLMRGNMVFDAGQGLVLSAETDRISVIGNVFYKQLSGRAITCYEGDNHELYFNTFIDSAIYATIGSSAARTDFQCNVVITGSEPGGALAADAVADYNAYYDAVAIEDGEHDLGFATAAEARNEDLCFTIKRWTDPSEYCVPNGHTTSESPHLGLCSSGIGARTDIGVDDRIWLPAWP